MPLTLFTGDTINVDLEVDQTINGGGAEIKGFEVAYQQDFTFLPEPFDGLGFQANYTRTSASADDPELAFPGTSKNSYNLIAYYEKGNFGARLAYNFRERYQLDSTPPSSSSFPEFNDDIGLLDLSVFYNISENLRIQTSVVNVAGDLLQEQTGVARSASDASPPFGPFEFLSNGRGSSTEVTFGISYQL